MSRLEVIGSRVVWFWHGAGDDRGTPSQVTAIRVAGVEAYVREGRKTRSIDHFAMSSGARLGHKADGDRVPGVEILELAAPRPNWKAIAELVREIDTLKREVRRNTRWGLDDARELWIRCTRPGTVRAHW